MTIKNIYIIKYLTILILVIVLASSNSLTTPLCDDVVIPVTQ